jgi:uncharacterized protein YjbI with pentapeptide repeats
MTAEALADLINEKMKTNDSIVIENVLIPSKIKHGVQFIINNNPSYYIGVKEFDRDETDTTFKSKTIVFRNCKLRDAEVVFSSRSKYNELFIFYKECEVQQFNVRIGTGYRYITFNNCKVQNCTYYGTDRTNIKACNETTFEYCVFESCSANNFIHRVGEKFVNCKFNDCDFVGAELFQSTFINCFCDTRTRGFQLVCPEKGEYIGFKKARVLVYEKSGKSALSDWVNHRKLKGSIKEVPVIVELRIPKDAKRSSATTRKCRASKAEVLSITSIDGKKRFKKAVPRWCCVGKFVYEVGKTVVPENGFEENRWIECAPGIHHFITRDEAVAY